MAIQFIEHEHRLNHSIDSKESAVRQIENKKINLSVLLRFESWLHIVLLAFYLYGSQALMILNGSKKTSV